MSPTYSAPSLRTERTSATQPPHQSKVLGEDGVGLGEGKGSLSPERFPFPSPMLHAFTGLNNSQNPAMSKGTHKS